MTLVLPLTSYHSLPGSSPRHDDSPSDWRTPKSFAGSPRRCDSPIMTASRARPASRPVTSSPTRPMSLSPLKRKQAFETCASEPRPKRISPFLNTPKQRRDELRKVLRLSANKFRQIEDHEACLRRVVLINNTVRRLEQQWVDDKRPCSTSSSYAARFMSTDHLETDEASRKRHHAGSTVCDFDFVGNSPLSSPPTALLEDFRSPCTALLDQHNDDMAIDALTRALDDSDSDESLPSPTDESTSLIDSLTSQCNSMSSCSFSSCPSTTNTFTQCSYSMTPTTLTSESSESYSDRTNLSDNLSTNLSTNLLPPSPASSMSSCTKSESDHTDDDNSISERDRLILGQMDIVFNNLISVLSEAAV